MKSNNITVGTSSLALAVTIASGIEGNGDWITLGWITGYATLNSDPTILPATGNPACTLDVYDGTTVTTYSNDNISGFIF